LIAASGGMHFFFLLDTNVAERGSSSFQGFEHTASVRCQKLFHGPKHATAWAFRLGLQEASMFLGGPRCVRRRLFADQIFP
jgi:hypothetical protein